MDINVSKKIIKDLRYNYDKISDDFSASRQNPWPEFKYFARLVKNGDRVLDLGCGNGRLFDYLYSKKIYYLGVDFSTKLIASARDKYEKYGARFQVKNILEYRTKKKFDVCFLVAVLHHIPSRDLRERLMADLYDVILPDGKIVISVWNLWQKKYYYDTLNYSLKSLFSKELDWGDIFMPYGEQKIPRYYHAFSQRELENLVRQSGFKVAESFYFLDGKKSNQRFGKNLIIVGEK